jgi:hypothetical protein
MFSENLKILTNNRLVTVENLREVTHGFDIFRPESIKYLCPFLGQYLASALTIKDEHVFQTLLC